MLPQNIARCGLIVAAITVFSVAASAQDFRQKAPAGAGVYFIEPKEGAEITGPVTVRFGLKGMGVAPAGVEKENTGHHHLLINQKLEDGMNAIPADDKHRHFGGGQTETTVTLPPGKYTLQLILGDHQHIPHNPPVQSEIITINVK